ncbi:predicted protein [Sclerotinia sclerotiorum 1980 UF-70]|uniref:Uncharacterized protein n=1 Tax=Sclerotinia sclerotiorum (strain ATCC 18683 / 1980 / Ss-1) TaxID=665079 RepID=A7F8D0_SCLS1|nr:predicted protein [Sclerotinia sclerotiorum 1980 UF-70]EDN99001.1 predicted protein [Sclerotinia sclerotiorum 1980 UF-70]
MSEIWLEIITGNPLLRLEGSTAVIEGMKGLPSASFGFGQWLIYEFTLPDIRD